jgi:hypothetical protein
MDELQGLVGESPVVKIKLGGVDLGLTLDSGSQVTTISEKFFNDHLKAKIGTLRDASSFLRLRAANGLELPYAGYFVADVEIFGRMVKQRGILVQKDTSFTSKTSLGLLGMNIMKEIPECQDWMKKITSVEDKSTQDVEGAAVKLANSTRTRIPAWAATRVKVTGPVCDRTCMVERLEEPLSGNILVSRTVVVPSEGIFEIRLINMGEVDVWLPAHAIVGTLCHVEIVEKESPEVNIVEIVAGQVLVEFQEPATASAAQQYSKDSVDDGSSGEGQDWLDKVALPDLGPHVTQKLLNVLKRHPRAFAQHDDDMGRTSTIKQRIHTTDDLPVRLAYRGIPPHLYQEFKEHMMELKRRGIITESKSENSAPIVLVRKKTGKLRLCVD